MEIGKLIIFQILISSGKLKMQEMHCILLVFYIGATFFCAREAWEMLYFTCIYTATQYRGRFFAAGAGQRKPSSRAHRGRVYQISTCHTYAPFEQAKIALVLSIPLRAPRGCRGPRRRAPAIWRGVIGNWKLKINYLKILGWNWNSGILIGPVQY